MKKLIMLALLAATVAPAAAQPYRGSYGQNYDRYGRDRYTARDNHRWKRDFRGRWVSLAQGYSGATDRQFVRLLGKGGTFRHLRIEADFGRPVIQKVVIEDTRGNTQVVELNERLAPGDGEVIRLNQGGAPINRIAIYTESRAGGSYSVFGG